jgi:20S proteasome subunit beta 2
MSRPLVFWLILLAATVVASSSSSDSSSPFSHPLLDADLLMGNSRPRARIEEWQLSDDDNDSKSFLGSRRRRRWQDDAELHTFPSLSEYTGNEREEGMKGDSSNDDDDDFSRGKSPRSLSLHLELPPSQSMFETTTPISSSSFAVTTNNNNKFKKTGTTIAGCCVKNHVLLAADTRATEATMVADKACQKLHQLATNSWCAGAGTSADLDHLTKECLYSLALQRLQESSIGNDNHNHNNSSDDGSSNILSVEGDSPLLLLHPVSAEALCNFFQDSLYAAGGNVGANLILGAVWKGEAQLRAIHPHGSMDVDLPFAALGSGGLAAMSVMEQGYRNDMTVEEGIDLVQRAILAGIRNDLGSGSQVDLCIIRPDGSSDYRLCVIPEEELEEGFVAETVTTPSSSSSRTEHVELGVNGFGNLPFAIQSKKTLLSSDAEKERLANWNEILGLN